MGPKRRRDRFKAWFWGFFSSKDEMHFMPDGPRRGNSPNHTQNIRIDNAIHVQGDHNTVVRQDGQGDRNIVTQIMSLLSKHIIPGAAHDSSPRDPPPRCHPNTRVKLIARITAWIENQASLELLLWITGPAGVGKSAVVQTLAEYLAESKTLGASVFISRPNKRDNPHGVFITIAYQLATRIEAYRDYIVERLSRDPELLNGGMQAQFIAFIVEPFVEKKFGTGAKRWGILLDGLDELRGTDAQCEIIQTISTFAQEHRDAPLVWIIASRSESHIVNTFEDDEVRRSYWSEYIPIDSTEACEDVERFLRSRFKETRKKFRHTIHNDWPSDSDFLKLTVAASGLFIYAEVVMQFIRDPGYADPVSRLEVLLSVIDRFNAAPTEENPFVHLDALYSEILSSIPFTGLWPTTKLFLRVTINGEYIAGGVYFVEGVRYPFTLRGMSILFGITQNVIYASLDKCRSTLEIPEWKVAHKAVVAFHHASFSDFLGDPRRSGNFYIGTHSDTSSAIQMRVLEVWNKCSEDETSVASVKAMWYLYCSKSQEQTLSRAIKAFYTDLFHDTIHLLRFVVTDTLQEPERFPFVYESLQKVRMRMLCYLFEVWDVKHFVCGFMRLSPDSEGHRIGFLREVRLRDLEFGHLDWKEMSPAYARFKHGIIQEMVWKIHRPRSSTELKAFVSDLKSLQQHSPELKVAIVGGVPKEQVAVFYRNRLRRTYIVPYPE
ncbi:hypothetical protein AGABI1DRAFT_129734 [Agaricus bisporus var. burnettii JB137-S8]|uniref:Nephrocystin 3-like N-terminal domain-containing protein n=1 Tax=Agaricus bisporus var. burnettii (strain JB137-S8 / ATCC MYA-4627 / FGSC 10392) TaxID=597362 RepID=K5XSK8_AGABU|nr:uncharacterized protein AGABI1DRAFT_129734 [Agaricus bisporus var. burnettii JB137-S8]EKM77945.1 hypothetical protein AGABI1DRAFT_129734 [Agaricus bisporus var. burnettii JB137-S8]